MTSRRSLDADMGLQLMSPLERRAAVMREDVARAEERQERLASLSSPVASPEDRIRTWERLFALSLPRQPTHKLVRIIAKQTDLSVIQVQDEQRRRAGQPLLGQPSAAEDSNLPAS